MLGLALKWFGGGAAVVSLALATWQLHDLVQGAREKAETVAELVRAADIQRAAEQYVNALAIIDEALKLDPASREARKLQVTIAMAEIRKLYAIDEEKLRELSATVAILNRGAVQADRQRAADALAHLGWVYHLRRTAGEKGEPIQESIQNFLRKALELDSNNPFAHTFWADWCLDYRYEPNCEAPIKTALAHYASALKGGRENEFVYDRILSYFCRDDLEFRLKQCASFLEDMKKNHYVLKSNQKNGMWWGVNEIFLREDKFTDLLKEAHRAQIVSAIKWIAEDEQPQVQEDPQSGAFERKIWSPRLKELAGQVDDALVEYNQLRLDARKWQAHHTINYTNVFPAIEQAMARLLDVRSGWLGLKLRQMYEDEAARIGLRGTPFEVLEVDPAGPANKAGIIAGDVILAINGQDLDSKEGRFVFGTAVAGQVIELKLWRISQPQKLNMITTEIPATPKKIDFPSDPTSMWYLAVMIDEKLYGPRSQPLPEYGITLAELTDDLRQGYSIPTDVLGSLILNSDWRVQHGNIGAGDVIVEVDRRPISGPEELIDALATARAANMSQLPITRFRNGANSALAWEVLVEQ